MVLRPKLPNPLTSSVLHTRPPPRRVSPPSSTGRPPSPPESRSTRTSAVLTRSIWSLSYTLALVDVPDVSHHDWSPGFLVHWSKPHVCPSPLPVHQHGTSLFNLHLTVDHCLRTPQLHNISQKTCCTYSFRHDRVSHHSTFFVDHVDNHSSQNETQWHISTFCSQKTHAPYVLNSSPS
jgi:hypothetical protein